MNIDNKLFKILYENGIIIDEEESEDDLEMDSVTFISLIISIEEEFNIIIPADMLLYEKWKTYKLINKNLIRLLNEM